MKSGASISDECLYKTFMRFLFLILFPLFLVGLGVYGAGSSLPEKNVIIHGVTLPAAKTEVWAQVHDIAVLPKWHSNVEKVTAAPKQDEEKIVWYVEAKEKQSYRLEVTYRLEPDIMQISMDENTLPYRSQWDISLNDKTVKAATKEEEDKVTTFLKITETAYTPNPFARFFMNYFIGYDSEVISYLESLAKYFKVENVEIRELAA